MKKKCSRKYSRILWERLPGFFLKSFMNPSNLLWDCSAENLEIISEFSSRYRFGIHPKKNVTIPVLLLRFFRISHCDYSGHLFGFFCRTLYVILRVSP